MFTNVLTYPDIAQDAKVNLIQILLFTNILYEHVQTLSRVVSLLNDYAKYQ